MMNELITLTKMYKMSQKELKGYVAARLYEAHRKFESGDGYVFSKGTFPVLLVAHLDTVHKKLPSKILYDPETTIASAPEGIGGDDRNGVFSVLKVLERFDCSVLFCEDEEIGGVGAEKFIKTETAKGLEFNYIIEFDRMNKNDAVFYDCDNPDFTDFITKEFYKEAYGSFSDISVLAPFLGCAAVNLSCGYYKAHTKDEFVVVTEIMKSIEEACKILERTTADDKFEYIEAVRNYRYGYGYSYYDWYDDMYDRQSYSTKKRYYLIEYTDEKGDTQWDDMMAHSEEEAIGMFCIDHPYLSFADINEICADSYTY